MVYGPSTMDSSSSFGLSGLFRLLTSSILLQKIPLLIKNQIRAFYFGFVHGFAGGVGYPACLADFGAVVMGFDVGRNACRQVAYLNGYFNLHKIAGGCKLNGIVLA